MPEPAIHVHAVTKRYGTFMALRGVDLDVATGEVFALLGPNGAGKTTLVEILEGYRDRTSGEVTVLGIDPRNADARWRSHLGIVLQNTTVFDSLTVNEVVQHFAAFYPAPLQPASVIAMVGLSEKSNARCGKLSGGQKRRVDLALGLVGDPDLVFLDEPTSGLDPEGRRQLWDVIRNFTALGKTVVLTTHYLDEAEALADRVGIIIRGEMADIGAPSEIGGGERNLSIVRFQLPASRPGLALPDINGLAREGAHVLVRTGSPTAAVAELARWAEGAGLGELPGLTVARPSLEETYLAMVRERDQQAA